MNRHSLFDAVDSALSSRGFERETSAWYRQLNEVFQVIQLEKLPMRGQFEPFVGFWLCNLDSQVAIVPTSGSRASVYHRAHIYYPMAVLIGLLPGDLRPIYNLEEVSISDVDRREALVRVNSQLVAALNALDSDSAIAAGIRSGRLEAGMIRVEARRFLIGST